MASLHRSVSTGIGTAVLLLALTGCTAPSEPVTTESAAAPTMTEATPTPTPTPTPEPSAEPSTRLADCGTVLDEAGNADLAEDNLKPFEYQYQSWDYPLLADFVADGVVCQWAGGGDVFVVVGQLAMDEATWDATRADLEAAGYRQDDSFGIEGFVDGPDSPDESYPTRGFVWRDGILYYVSYPGILEFVPAFQS